MIKIVLDTNILLSGMIFPGSLPAKVLDLARNRTIEAYTSPFIVSELKKVLMLKFNYSSEEVELFVGEIITFCKVVITQRKYHLIKGYEKDNNILDCAFFAKADYLVTGDKKHILPLKETDDTKIVSAREFMEIIEQK